MLPELLSPPASRTVLSLRTVAVKPETPTASPVGRVVKPLPERLKISALVSGLPELPMPPTISAWPFGKHRGRVIGARGVQIPVIVQEPGACAEIGSARTRITQQRLKNDSANATAVPREVGSTDFIFCPHLSAHDRAAGCLAPVPEGPPSFHC